MQAQFRQTRKNFASVPKTPANNNRAPLQRPQKCYNCKKMIPATKYNQHCETCYRFKQQAHPTPAKKVVPQRINSKPLPNNTRSQSLNPNQNKNITRGIKPKQQESMARKESTKAHEKGSKFRIRDVSKNESKVDGKKQTPIISKKLQQEKTIGNSLSNPEQEKVPNKQMENGVELIKKQRRQEQEQSEAGSVQTPPTNRVRAPKNSFEPSESEMRERQSQLQHLNRRQQADRREQQDEIIVNENNEPSYLIRDRQPQSFRRQTEEPQERPSVVSHNVQNRNSNSFVWNNNQRVQIIPVLTIRQDGPALEIQEHEEETENINELINNTNQIVRFIENMGQGEDEALQIMVAQLRQLNTIAYQIRDLDMIGSNLGFRMGSVFARRIRELQTTIINQIGIALIRRFHQRVGLPDFQLFLARQPQLRSGFSKTQIDNLFPNQVNYSQAECSICLQDVRGGSMVKKLQCNHKFHPDCIQHWLQASKQCPMCRHQQTA